MRGAAALPIRRRGAARTEEIPPQVMADLNAGLIETVTLVEWLAIDMAALAAAVLPGVGLADRARHLVEAARLLEGRGFTRRMRGMGEILHTALRPHPRRDEIHEALATHRSDMVRAWAAYVVAADRALALPDRLRAMRRFACDRAGTVRDATVDALRPFVVADLEQGLRIMVPWVLDLDPDVRRCAIETTRPRGVWQRHVEPLKRDPALASALLEPVRSDPSRSVQRSLSNWLNDASKSQPDWVRALCSRWRQESPTAETAWIVERALRTLHKAEARGARPVKRRR
jgi:3-methyladenine DNA glycosylase AlkC